MRRMLAVPTQDRIDFRAACFCHKRIVDIGFVCSVCLSSTSFTSEVPFVREHSLLPFPDANFLTDCRSLLSTCSCLFHLSVRTVSYSSRPLYMGPSDSLVLNPMLIIQWFFSP